MARDWTILSKHGITLVCVARDPGMRLIEIAECVGVRERTAFGIVSELCEAGYLRRYKEGNRNRYEVNPEMPLRHRTMQDHWVGEVLAVLAPEGVRRPPSESANGSAARSIPA